MLVRQLSHYLHVRRCHLGQASSIQRHLKHSPAFLISNGPNSAMDIKNYFCTANNLIKFSETFSREL